jgi:hypothetical protein
MADHPKRGNGSVFFSTMDSILPGLLVVDYGCSAPDDKCDISRNESYHSFLSLTGKNEIKTPEEFWVTDTFKSLVAFSMTDKVCIPIYKSTERICVNMTIHPIIDILETNKKLPGQYVKDINL